MSRPTVYIFDVETQTGVTRKMNDAEFAQYEIDKAAWETEQAEIAVTKVEEDAKIAAKKTAKTQALAALGLSQEVVNLLAE